MPTMESEMPFLALSLTASIKLALLPSASSGLLSPGIQSLTSTTCFISALVAASICPACVMPDENVVLPVPFANLSISAAISSLWVTGVTG